MPRTQEARAGGFASTFTKAERECTYWVVLFLIVLCYCLFITQGSYAAAFLDLTIMLARAFRSPFCLIPLGVLFVMICRCTTDGRRAVWYFYGLVIFVTGLYFLDLLIFPHDLVPIQITRNWTLFDKPANWTHWRNESVQRADRAWLKKYGEIAENRFNQAGVSLSFFGFYPLLLTGALAFSLYAARADSGWANAAAVTAIGIAALVVLKTYGFSPVLLIAQLGFALYLFRVESNVAYGATAIVIGAAVLMAFKPVLDQYIAAYDSGSLMNMTNTTHVTSWTNTSAEPNILPAAWVDHTDSFQIEGALSDWAGPPLRAERTAGSSRTHLERLRIVESQLDHLLSRTGATR